MSQPQARTGSGQHRGESSVSRRNGSRRSWSSIEEHTLLNAFKDIIACGWKTPNGFRTGYIQQLEARMKLAMPGTDLREDPHILSKYGSWKKTYREVHEVIGATGMRWNGTTKTVQAEPRFWDLLIQHKPDLAYVREKPFPFYERWVEMYGRDGATGNGAFDFNGPLEENGAGNGLEETQENNNSPAGVEGDNNTQAQSTTPIANSTTRSDSKGKRKRVDDVNEIVETISKMWGDATSALKDMADAIRIDVTTRVDVQAAANRRNVYETVKALSLTLTRAGKVRAASALIDKQDQLDMLFELPDEEKCDLVYLALTGDTWQPA